jgi:hypothetical protein
MLFQAMGRERACQKLLETTKTIKTVNDEDHFFALCRMLFERRAKGEFRRPMIGAAGFLGDTDYADWPLEPIELVDGVPFLITNGYKVGGEPESPESYLRYCMENCDWSTARFREPSAGDMREALSKLISYQKWKRRLNSHEKDFLAAQIE